MSPRLVTTLLALLALTSAAAADPIYPTQLVERTPWLPADLTEVSATFTAHGSVGEIDVDALVRHSFGAIEGFAGAIFNLRQPPRPGESAPLLDDAYAGVRVGITAHSGLRVKASRGEGSLRGLSYYGIECAYEARIPIPEGNLALRGEAGTVFEYGRAWGAVSPSDPPMLFTATSEDAFAIAALDIQSGPRFAIEPGARLDVRYTQTGGFDYHDQQVDLYLAGVYAFDDVDLVAKVDDAFTGPAPQLELVAGAAARF